MTKRTWVLWVMMTEAVVFALAVAVCPVQAQCNDPTCAAEIIRRATDQAQAQRWQAQQAATRQAAALSVGATATSQAQDAKATATHQALDATATASAVELEATRQAYTVNVNATATSQAQGVQAQATQQAIDAEATRAVYQVQLSETKERSDFGTLVLYAAGILALAGCAFVVWTWARRLAGSVKPVTPDMAAAATVGAADFTPGDAVIVDASRPDPTTPPEVRTVNNPGLVDAIGQWFYGSGENE
jgi:hypothetical protein